MIDHLKYDLNFTRKENKEIKNQNEEKDKEIGEMKEIIGNLEASLSLTQ